MSNVAVCVRFRPQNFQEALHGASVVLPESADRQSFAFQDEIFGETTFSFDRVFYEECSQADLYDAVAFPIVKDVMNAINGTILAYGQTSAGKTYTMEGPNMLTDAAETKGILPRVAQSIFEIIDDTNATIEFIIKLSMVEIYKEKIRDLFDASKDNLQVKEDKVHGIFVAGATETCVQSEDEMVKLLEAGITNRVSGATQMNARSSRSHCVCLLTIQQIDTENRSTRTGKLYLVDLAGSEKVEKTGVEGSGLEEAKMINKSLSALGNVINSLTTDKAGHVPYRDSKLTRILQESLDGNSRTTLLCCCSPSFLNSAETLSTLRFGARAKQIKNKPRMNAQPGRNDVERLLEQSRQEYEELRSQFLELNVRLGLSAHDTTLVTDAHILDSRGQDIPNCISYQRVSGKNGPPLSNGVISRMKDLFIREGVIPRSSTSDFASPNDSLLEDFDESDFDGLFEQNTLHYPADVESASKAANNTVDKTLHLLKKSVEDLSRKCEKLLQENEELKMEVIALERVLAHSRKQELLTPELQDDTCPQNPSIVRPVRWGGKRSSKGTNEMGAQEVDGVDQDRPGGELKIPVWNFLCRFIGRNAFKRELSPLAL